MIAFQLEKWDKAIEIYSAVVKADPADQDARLTLGNMYLAKGDKAKAREQFQAAFDAKADGPLAFVALARIALLKDDLQTADENLKRAATKGKKDATVLRQRGESYLFYVAPGSKKASLTRCEELLKEAVEINSKEYATLMALAYCYKEMPDGGRSALNYEYAELADPKNPLPKLMLALVYKAAKVPEKPLQYFDKAIAAQANFTPALRGKADYQFFICFGGIFPLACKVQVVGLAAKSRSEVGLCSNGFVKVLKGFLRHFCSLVNQGKHQFGQRIFRICQFG
ncbi:MAG: tetratricopeptide repeat protein, partial [Bacteroidota bacterium]